MRTTIHLPDDLLVSAKRAAADSNRTLTALIEEALRASLSKRRSRPRVRVDLPTFGEGGPRPGVDLDDSAALLDLLEGHDAAD